MGWLAEGVDILGQAACFGVTQRKQARCLSGESGKQRIECSEGAMGGNKQTTKEPSRQHVSPTRGLEWQNHYEHRGRATQRGKRKNHTHPPGACLRKRVTTVKR